MNVKAETLEMLACPRTGEPLVEIDGALVNRSGSERYRISPSGIPLFAEKLLGEDARRQQAHYDRVASAYLENLGYPHTQEYLRYLDTALLAEFDAPHLARVGEICCGRGEALRLLDARVGAGLGIDVSARMLEAAQSGLPRFAFVQGDATRLPVADRALDAVVMLGGFLK